MPDKNYSGFSGNTVETPPPEGPGAETPPYPAPVDGFRPDAVRNTYRYPQPPPYYYMRYQPRRRSAVRTIIALIIAIVFFSLFGWALVVAFGWSTWDGSPLTVTTETNTVKVGVAQSADVDLTMGVGNLRVANGAAANDLMNATFTYDQSRLKPTVLYSTGSSVGQLSVSQPENRSWVGFTTHRNEWDLRLNNDMPINMTIRNGVGNTDLNLQGLNLTNLVVNDGVGNTNLTFGGTYKQSFKVSINGGTGDITLVLPRDTGARVQVSKGLGSINTSGRLQSNGTTYTNEAFGKSNVNIEIEVRVGVGSLRIIAS